jgi:hypothetical protein
VLDSLSERVANRLGDKNDVEASLEDGCTPLFLFGRCVVWKACRLFLGSLMVVVGGYSSVVCASEYALSVALSCSGGYVIIQHCTALTLTHAVVG